MIFFQRTDVAASLIVEGHLGWCVLAVAEEDAAADVGLSPEDGIEDGDTAVATQFRHVLVAHLHLGQPVVVDDLGQAAVNVATELLHLFGHVELVVIVQPQLLQACAHLASLTIGKCKDVVDDFHTGLLVGEELPDGLQYAAHERNALRVAGLDAVQPLAQHTWIYLPVAVFGLGVVS